MTTSGQPSAQETSRERTLHFVAGELKEISKSIGPTLDLIKSADFDFVKITEATEGIFERATRVKRALELERALDEATSISA